jgi:hypothetical protein
LVIGLLTKSNLIETANEKQKEDQDRCDDPAKDDYEGAKDVHRFYASVD